MPLFKRICRTCKKEFGYFAHHIEDVVCLHCGSRKHEAIFPRRLNATDTFKKKGLGYWEELGDVDDKDAYVTSRKQLKEVCRKKGLKSRYLEDRC